MDKDFFKRAAWESVKAALAGSVFSLFATAIVAVFVQAYAPAQSVLTAVNWILKCVAAFVFCLIFVRRDRAFFKGAAAGLLTDILTMLLFAAIGGGFRIDILFLPELLLCAVLGGLGALLGAKLRKE